MEDEDTYHYDFTTASEFEIFIARLEEIIIDWGLHKKPLECPLQKNDFKNKVWCSSSETLTFSDAEFLLVRYYLKCDKVEEEQDYDLISVSGPDSTEEKPGQALEDMMVTENDFFPITNPPSKDTHPLARWYGLRDFLVLIPQHSSYVASESRVKILLSTISIATSNTKCKIPFFLLALEPWQNYFLGIYQNGNFFTDFQMVHLKRTPPHCKFLNGLLTVFKSKIGLEIPLAPVQVSVQFTYILKDWGNNSLSQDSPGLNFGCSDSISVAEIKSLPFGSICNSISELHLHTLWPKLLENTVIDGENYSDLDPLQAPIWKLSIVAVDNPDCLLTDHYIEFVVLTRGKHSLKDLLGNLINSNPSVKPNEISSSLNALTESKISAFSKAVIGAEKTGRRESHRQSQQSDNPISEENLMTFLYYLFPDADINTVSAYKNFDNLAADSKGYDFEKKLGGMKSAPVDGLIWRLAIVMSHVIHSLGGVRSAAYLWYEFTQELRFRWENFIPVPGVEPGHPNSRTCLLNQKLQLLNCCILKRMEREKRERNKSENDGSDSEEAEEFYDCEEDEKIDEKEEEKGGQKPKCAPLDKPIGRLTKHGDLKLLETGEPMYIPVTQEVVSKTEDELEEDAKVLLELGTDAHGSELRARLMSASLLSDMEAFKAANPGCILADFVRWYSPRDWIEEENGETDEFGQRKGHLSKRMEIPGNTWLEVWQVAQPVPAKWQRRLFNDTKESEKVLDFLERKTPKEFIELLLPVMIVCVIHKLLEESSLNELPGVQEILMKLIKKAEMLGRMPKIEGSRYEELINEISSIETLLVHAKSLASKFSKPCDLNETNTKTKINSELMKFISSLLTNSETEVPGGPKSEMGSIIRQYFSDAAKAEQLVIENQLTSEKWNVMSPFPSPHEKEMILRVSTIKGPQRLHVVLKKNECRLCGAFTKNIYHSK